MTVRVMGPESHQGNLFNACADVMDDLNAPALAAYHNSNMWEAGVEHPRQKIADLQRKRKRIPGDRTIRLP